MKNDKLKNYQVTGTQHPKWRWKGKTVDLREIDDQAAEALHKSGFAFVKPLNEKPVAKAEAEKKGPAK